MSGGTSPFVPHPSLVPGTAHSLCRACVVVPGRNEETALSRCLDALSVQLDTQGRPLPEHHFEVVLLLNNCTDQSAEVARAWQVAHPALDLYVVERTLPPAEAHVGTARRLLMDTAWWRLQAAGDVASILSTDADTQVAPDWVARNLDALGQGADAVGGLICLVDEDLCALPEFVRNCYKQDRRYAALVAELEHALDPRPGDGSPRHLDHFGSSLACTRRAYAVAGGMPAISPLEDEAFVDRIRRANLFLRHDPTVRVYTSARLDGRAAMGLACQLRLWDGLAHCDQHLVPSAAFLEHRFRMMRRLREIFATKQVGDLHLPTEWWENTFAESLRDEATCPGFLGAIYCDIFIAEAFAGPAQEPIAAAIEGMERWLSRLFHDPLLAEPSRLEGLVTTEHAQAALAPVSAR